jgi:hypothetical protein
VGLHLPKYHVQRRGALMDFCGTGNTEPSGFEVSSTTITPWLSSGIVSASNRANISRRNRDIFFSGTRGFKECWLTVVVDKLFNLKRILSLEESMQRMQDNRIQDGCGIATLLSQAA